MVSQLQRRPRSSQQNQQPDPYISHCQIFPDLNPAWFNLTPFEQQIWVAQAQRALPGLARLFHPAWLTVAFWGPYQAWLRLHVEVASEEGQSTQWQSVDLPAPVNLMELPR